jgi:hypothetical protein
MASFVPFFNRWAKTSTTFFTISAGVLPPIAYKVFDLLFHSTLKRLSRYQGAATQSYLQRSLLAWEFASVVISELIVFTFIGVGFSEW